jgi:hypothetical protein
MTARGANMNTSQRDGTLAFLVGVKYRVRFAGWRWSSKNLGGMGLYIRRDMIDVRLRARVLSALLGATWQFIPWQTRCEVSREPAAWYRPREWVVLSTVGGDERDVVAVTTSRRRIGNIWSALVDAGVAPTSPPPGDERV